MGNEILNKGKKIALHTLKFSHSPWWRRHDYWTFRDGVSIDEELRDVELSRIRTVCDQQSRTKWTSIASRDRLYQFIALSDEKTQLEMRQKALSLVDMNSRASASQFDVSAAGTSSSALGAVRPTGTKR
jgi:hypothetical protein